MGHTGEAIDTNVSALIKTTVVMSTTEDSVDVAVGEVVTVVVDATEHAVEQITKQLYKLIQVHKVLELDDATSVGRQLLLVKVKADNLTRPQVVDAANLFRARVIDVAVDSVIIEATGNSAKLKAFLEVMESFGIRELARSGAVALSRGSKTMAKAD